MARLILIAAAAACCSLAGCVLGAEQAPGCRLDHPEDCQEGWSCRAGLCVRPTTTLSTPEAGADGAVEASAEGGDAADATSEQQDSAPGDGSQDSAPSDAAAEAEELPDGGWEAAPEAGDYDASEAGAD
jgi:hypothetical protein